MKGKAWSSIIPQIDKGPLKRVLGVSDLFAVGFGDLGSSIYYALGVTALFSLGATPLSMGLAGLVFICTALSYAELTAAFHESGGSASFARHAFNDLISFVAGWGLLLDYIVTIAISAFTIGPYLANFVPALHGTIPQILFSISIIGILYVINFFGVKQSTRMSFILMVFTVITQLFIIALGFALALRLPQVFQQMKIGVQGVDWSPSWHEFIKGTAMAMVAYTGIESIAQLGAETKRPARTVPRSIFLIMLVLIVMYLGLSIVALGVMTPQQLGNEYMQDPITGIAKNLSMGSEYIVPWIGVLAAIVLFVAANAGLIGASRLSYNMGEYYQLPRFFYAIHKTHRTPYIALAFFAVASAIIVALSQAKLSFLADLYNFGAQIAFFSTHLSLIVLRIKKPNLSRPFRVPLNIRIRGHEIPIPALFGCLATASVWLLVVITKPEGRYLGFSWIGLGLLMYFLYRRRERIPAMGQVTLEKIKVPEFVPITAKHILVPVRSSTQMETVQVACELAKFHGAKLTAIHVIEVPFTLPLDTLLPQRMHSAAVLLKTVEAIARDFGLNVDIQVVRARSVSDAILDFCRSGSYDLLILGSMKSHEHKGLGPTVEAILQKSTCRVWVCGSDHNSKNILQST